MPHNDALVVTVTVANHAIHQVLVDNGSSADILYWPTFKQMGIDRDRIKLFGSPLVGFGREQVQLVGIIPLPVIVGTAPRLSIVMVDFLIDSRSRIIYPLHICCYSLQFTKSRYISWYQSSITFHEWGEATTLQT
jgi:hypothetical protein